MNLSNCSGCGKLHLQSAQVLCRECFHRHLEDSRTIKAFLQTHPGASVIDLVRQTGLSLKKVNELVNR